MNSGNYYDDFHPTYIHEVQDVDLSFIYNQFLHLIKKKGTILDAWVVAAEEICFILRIWGILYLVLTVR